MGLNLEWIGSGRYYGVHVRRANRRREAETAMEDETAEIRCLEEDFIFHKHDSTSHRCCILGRRNYLAYQQDNEVEMIGHTIGLWTGSIQEGHGS